MDIVVSLVEHLLCLGEILQSGGCLHTGNVVEEPQYLGLSLVEVDILGQEVVEELLPAGREPVEFVVALLLVEHIAQIGVYLLHHGGQRRLLEQDIETFLIGAGTLVEVVHVEVDITHHVVGNAQSLLVVALLGIGIHALYLAQGDILAFAVIY